MQWTHFQLCISSGHREIQDGRRQILVCIVNSSEKLIQ